jgi:glucokinase-like ROK family protein
MRTSELKGAPRLDHLAGTVTVLDLVRSGSARTRPELVRASGLGRNVVTARVDQLLDLNILAESGVDHSTGGRPSRELRFNEQAGMVLVAPLGATGFSVGLTDLAGTLLDQRTVPWDIGIGPEETLSEIQRHFDRLLAKHSDKPLYGIGVGLPGPVEFATARPVNPPIMPGWDAFPLRERLSERYSSPVWVDNDVNLMALGELRAGAAQHEDDFLMVKIGTGIGAGIVASGKLHRGAQGCAGDIGHVAVSEAQGIVCRCGNTGCLEAVAGGAAMVRDATAAAAEGRSPRLQSILNNSEHERLEARDITAAATYGDAVAIELLSRSGRMVGETLATLVNFFDPSLVLLGGQVADSGDVFLAAVRQTVYGRSLPLATRDLRIMRASAMPAPSLLGAAFLVLDQLFSREGIGAWIQRGAPVGHLEMTAS